jgi:hypothetical protein
MRKTNTRKSDACRRARRRSDGVEHTRKPEWVHKPSPVPAARAKPAQPVANIPLGSGLLPTSSEPTRRLNRRAAVPTLSGRACLPICSCSRWGLPCRPGHPGARCALTAPFHPCRANLAPFGLGPAFGGLFSVALSVGSPRLAVSQHLALWSSDFPPANTPLSRSFASVRRTHSGETDIAPTPPGRSTTQRRTSESADD